MSQHVTQLLAAAAHGDRQAAADLLPLVYDELRELAAARMAQERPGQTLQATALVHEVYVKLVGTEDAKQWQGRGHFFAAAAESMRRILVDQARRKKRLKHGGDRRRLELDDELIATPQRRDDLLALDAALDKLKQVDGSAAELVQLRYFAGLTVASAAEVMDISISSAERLWRYARAWLHQEIEATDGTIL
jgi:RNA polymerase sigma factor (TIGR02999 family)